MQIAATIKNSVSENTISISTEGLLKNISIPGKASGGSSVNGGELLFLALATCFCNDVYREADRRKMNIRSVEVSVTGEFGKEGEPASNIIYNATIDSDSASDEIELLLAHVDRIAEVHNTLRQGVAVRLQTAMRRSC